ncbi:sensor histidine kinase [Geobacter argillaceus]|uniref:histidine kinase n=1 Tax=Geobacter argillaceus TaxID=345631 RepID=A0A562WR31_9BACT|nr:HAMP domain-containing sensor histidine kinase [Geobacter argillaceus]TWJ32581.1 histidine kinase [Geobacter argillaceus]
MTRLKRYFTPVVTMVAMQLVWVLLVILWISWMVGRHRELRRLLERYRPEMVPPGFDWVSLVEGLILLLVVLAGFYAIFLFWKRQSSLYQRQRAFITQVTHELKSPLASIQLHLETIRLRKPSPDKLERFLETMLSDTERLNNLINNILIAAKLEQRRGKQSFPVQDLSAFVTRSLEQKRKLLPEGGCLTMDIEPGIKAPFDSEGVETALRNLLENAMLYSPAAPEITVTLKKSGRACQLIVSDRGKGLSAAELRKVFRMFYRVREHGENIRGSGLGLYIVKSVAQEHGGSVHAESAGPGRGTTFIVTLPCAE